MLASLRIRNVGAVDEVVLELEPGLTVLTGETGAGKTLLLEALHLVLGGAPRSLPVRDPDRPVLAEALFVEAGGDEVVLARELAPGGRLRAAVDGHTASARQLAERGEVLCHLHGQHEHQVLRTPGAARALLDRAAGIDDSTVRSLRAEERTLRAERDSLGGDADDRSRRLDLASHELAEIDAVSPTGPLELDERLEEVQRLSEVVESRDALGQAASILDDEGDGPSAAQLLSAALAALPRGLQGPRDELLGIVDQVRALAAQLRADLEALEADPGRLDALNERVARLQGLVRKHGQTLTDVLARRAALASDVERLEAADATLRELDGAIDASAQRVGVEEARLLGQRTAGAAVLGEAVTAQLERLALARATFTVAVGGAAGEDVTFLFSGSASFAPAPLADAASGGELSRVMLALTLCARSGAPTIVFDEVDAGVGGATARVLAACLADVAQERQVLVVTHLASIAAVAAHHFVVTPGDGTIPTTLLAVSGDERTREIARMLAGDASDPVALDHARALLAGDPVSS
jgi:DNA repair protein RecN (Recombination protein N)